MSKKKKIIIIISAILVVIILTVITIILINVIKQKQEQEEWQKLVKEYYDNKYALYEQENLEYEEADVIFLGDSLTDGYDLAKYYPEYVALNRGIGGDTTTGLLNRIELSTAVKSKVIVMLIGINNINTMFEDYEQLLIYLTSLEDTKIVLLSLTAMGDTWARNNDKAILSNQKIKLLAKKYNFIYIDLFTPLCNPETNMIYEEYTVDGGHFTSLGYEVITGQIKPILADLIGED